jgi:hypothetical protein
LKTSNDIAAHRPDSASLPTNSRASSVRTYGVERVERSEALERLGTVAP